MKNCTSTTIQKSKSSITSSIIYLISTLFRMRLKVSLLLYVFSFSFVALYTVLKLASHQTRFIHLSNITKIDTVYTLMLDHHWWKGQITYWVIVCETSPPVSIPISTEHRIKGIIMQIQVQTQQARVAQTKSPIILSKVICHLVFQLLLPCALISLQTSAKKKNVFINWNCQRQVDALQEYDECK